MDYKSKGNLCKEGRSIFQMITWDWATLLVFEVLYKILLTFLFQFGQGLLSYSIHAAGVEYLTNQNLIRVLLNPISLAGFLIVFILAVYLTFVEIAAVVLYLDCAAENRKTGVFRLFLMGSKRALSVFLPKNLGMVILLLLMMPLTGIVLTSGPLGSVKVPGFILEFIYEHRLLGICYALLTFLLLFLLLQWIFSLQEFILHRCTFQEARAKSRELVKGRRIRTFFYLLLGMVFAALTAAAVKILTVFLLLIFVRLNTGRAEGLYEFWFYYHRLTDAGNILYAAFRTVCLLGMTMMVYKKYRQEDIRPLKVKTAAKAKIRAAVKVLAAVVCLELYIEMINPFVMNDLSRAQDIQVVAHRAGAAFGPENSAAALKESIKGGADGAEIDVQQTKDGELVVMHDTDFKRIAGVDRKVWDVTYEEASQYEIGEGFRNKFRGERLSTLEHMIEEADGRIDLMIELKRSGHETQLVEKTVELIRKHHFESQCTIASLDYALLERVKELAPDLKTVYIAAVAYGDMAKLTAADAVSVEETFINSQLIAQAGIYGKSVYAWTINEEEGMRKMMSYKVDGIITDNIYLTSYMLETRGRSIWVTELAELLFDPIKTDK